MSDVKFSIFSQYPFLDINIYQYGYEKCDSLHSFGPSIRNHYLFHYIISGKGKLVSRDEDDLDRHYNLEAGNGFLIVPGQVTMYEADDQSPWEYVWIEFDGLIIKEALETAGLSINNPVFKSNDRKVIEKIEKLLINLIEEKNESPYLKIGDMYHFLHYLNENKDYTKGTSTFNKVNNYYINELTHFIEHHYNEDITVEDIANFLNLSRGHVNKIFKKYTNQTPKEFLTKFRMTKATNLLRTTTLPIGEIGNQIGYNNQLHFSRAFKNYFGVSPKIWRQLNKNDSFNSFYKKKTDTKD